MAKTTALIAGFLLFSPAQPTITAPPEVVVAPGDIAAVRVLWAGDDFRYKSSAGLNTFREYEKNDNVCALRCMAQRPGEYEIVCIACKGGILSEFVTIKVKVGTAPQPPPAPDDPITPAVGKLAVIVVEDDAPRTLQAARVLTDKAMWDEITSRGNTWRIIPSGSPLCVSKGYCQVAAVTGYPSLLLIAPDGRVLSARKLPGSSAEVLNAVKEYQR